MKGWKIQTIAFALMSLAFVACGSILSESERIRKLYEFKNGTAPTVTATDPTDNTFAPYNQVYIDITFSTAIDTATFTPQTSFGACTGSMQVSYDGFVNCLGGTVDASLNPQLRFTPTIFPKGLGLQIRVTSGVLSSVGVPATPYTSTIGFKLGAPCGNQNCFFSYSTPLMQNAGGNTLIFQVRSGANNGKYLIISGGSATILDPVAITTAAGPTVPGACSPADGAHTFYIASGATHAGKQAIIPGGGSVNWCLFDGTTITNQGSMVGLSAGSGGLSLQPSGANGDTYILRGFSTNGIFKYATASESFSDETATYSMAGSIGGGAHAIKMLTGINSGKWLIFNGLPAPSNATWQFTEAPVGFAASTAITAAAMGGGASSFETGGSTTGKIITILGGNSTAVSVLDTQTFAAPTLQNSALSVGASSAALLLNQSGYSPLLLHGGVGAPHITSLYNGTSFVAGPRTTGAILDGSAKIFIPSGSGNGAFFIVNGTGMPSTSVYFPASNSFSPTRTPTNVPNSGSNAFYVNAGAGVVHPGKTIIISGNGSDETAIFDPIRHEIVRGNTLPGNATADSFNYTLTGGPNAGKVLIFAGANYYVYNPVTNQFSTSSSLGWPSLPGSYGAGGIAFPIAGDNRIIIIRGNGHTVADILDPSGATPSFGTAINIGCGVSLAPMALRYTAGGVVKQLVYCSGQNVVVFDHASLTFSGPFTVLSNPAGLGIQGFVIPSGVDAGKLLIISGAGNINTTVHDPNNISTVSAGPALGTCAANVGSQLFQIQTGGNAGKYLLLAGNGTTNSCFFNTAQNPAASSLAPGPGVSSGASAGYNVGSGAVAFKTNGGLYPNSIVILPGANKNVWGTYVP